MVMMQLITGIRIYAQLCILIVVSRPEKYDLLLERRQLDKNKSETRNDQQSVASVSLNLG